MYLNIDEYLDSHCSLCVLYSNLRELLMCTSMDYVKMHTFSEIWIYK